MKSKRVLSLVLALVMSVSPFMEILPIFAAATELSSDTPAPADSEETVIASYDIPSSQVTLSEDGALLIDLPKSLESMINNPESTESSEPNISDDSKENTNATEPSEPTETVAAPDPSVPEESTEAAESTEPTEPAASVDDAESTEPTGPAASVDNTESTEPTEPSIPAEDIPDESVPTDPVYISWYNYLSAAGNVVSKENCAAVRSAYLSFAADNQFAADNLTLAGQTLTATVSPSGHFGLEDLLYDAQSPWSSETRIIIDDTTVLPFEADSVSAAGSSITAAMSVAEPSMEISQIISFVPGTDMLNVRYTVLNRSATTHSVRIAVLLDTAMNENDAPLFSVEDEEICTGTSLTGEDVPADLSVLNADSIPAADLMLRGEGLTAPSAVTFCNWQDLYTQSSAAVSDALLTDSAVYLEYADITTEANGSAQIAFCYGPHTSPEETDVPEQEDVPDEEPTVLSWFQWVEEKGIEISALSKSEYSTLRNEFTAYRLNTIYGDAELPEGAGRYGKISNSNIEVAVSSSGRFTIGNKEGNPDYASDNNQILLFGHPDPSTSETLIVIGNSYSDVFTADSTTFSSDTATSTMTISAYNIKVTQTLKLVKSGNASFADQVRIQYTVKNTGRTNRNVGIRIMMDTMLADNDHAPFRVSGTGAITTCKTFTGTANIPKMYQVYDNLDDPTTLSTGYFYMGSERKPDKVQFCSWPNIVGSSWNHSPVENSPLGDSAVGIYFNPKAVAKDCSFTVKTHYGVSVSTSSNNDVISNADGRVCVRVADSNTNEGLADATITYVMGGKNYTAKTDINGYALLESWYNHNLGMASPVTPMPVSLNISKDGYAGISVQCSMDRNMCCNYKLAKAKARPSVTSVHLIDGSTQTDLLQNSVYFHEDSEGLAASKNNTSTITIQATSNMSGCTYVFCENGGEVTSNTTGKFTFKVYQDGNKRYIEKLKPNADHTIICIKDKMHSEEQRFNLKIAAQTNKLDLFPMDLNDFIPGASKSFAKGSVAALFLGSSVKFGPKDADFDFKLEVTDSGYVRLGLNVDSASWNSLKGTSAEKQQEQLKDAMEAWMSDGFSKKSGKDLRKFFKKNQKFVLGEAEFEFCVGGYGEGQLKNGKLEFHGFQIHMAVKGEASNTHYYVVWGCPAYISIGSEIGAKTSITGTVVSGDPKVFKMSGEAMFNLLFKLTLQGGFGVKGCASIGAEGTASSDTDFNLVSKTILSKLKGTVSLFIEVFLFKKDVPVLEGELVVYDSNNPHGASDGGMITDLVNEVPFRLITREEAYAESAQGGTSTGIGEVRFLTVGSTQYKFFLEDRGGSDLSNRNRLAYSVLTDGIWSDAVPVWDDNTTDLYYDITTDGTDIHVVWSNSCKRFIDDTVTVDEMGAAQEIYYTVIASDGTIAKPLRITENDALDVMPAVSLANDTAYVAWYHTSNGIEHNTDVDDHYLNYTSITDGVPGPIASINCSNAAINTVSASTINGVPVVSYITNASTATDFQDNVHHELTLSTGSVTTVEASGKELGKPITGMLNGEEKIFWMENGNVAYADSMSGEAPSYVFDPESVPTGISMNNYTVISVSGDTYLIWTHTNENDEAVAMTSVYTGNAWSAVHPLTTLSKGNVTKLDGYLNSDGNLVLAYTTKYRTDVSGSSEIVTATLEKVVVPEQTLEVSGIYFDPAAATPGQALPLSFTVRNSGNTAIESIDIAIASETGEVYNSSQIIHLEPGHDAAVEIADFTLSEDLATRSADDAYIYTVNVCATGSNLSQERTFEIGCDNIRVSLRDTAYLDNRKHAVLNIENNSGFPASDVHVRVLADSEDGVMIYNNTIGDLAAHDQMSLYLDIDNLNSSTLHVFTSTTCTPSKDATTIVLFTPITSGTLTVTAQGGGSVTPSVPGEFDTGDIIAITADAWEGYSFAGWTSYKDLVFVSSDASSSHAEIEMPVGNTTVTAVFLSDTAYDFTLSDESISIAAGEQMQLDAEFASAMESSRVYWTSDDTSVATVSENGLVTGLSAGTATITAVSGEYSHTCTVTVSYVDINAVTLVTSEYYLAVGETASVKALTDPENGVGSLIWTSSDSTVAEVDAAGNILARSTGTATITAVSRNNDQVSAPCTVHVVTPVRNLLLNQQELYLDPYNNTTAELEISFDPFDATYGKYVTWTVEDEGIVSITPSGEFNEKLTITVAGHGATVIHAETENGCVADCSIFVEDILYVSSINDLQSSHPYEPGINRTWVYTDETMDFMVVSLSDETELGEHDSLSIMDGEGNLIYELGHYESGSFDVIVPGSTVQLHLSTTSDSEGAYGFRVTEITDELNPDLLNVHVENMVYTGKALTPYVNVYYGNMYLQKGYDYSITYTNNKAIGLGNATVTCIGFLEGLQKTVNFEIRPGNTELSGSIVRNGIKLSWPASKGAGGYRLFRSINGGQYFLYQTLKSSSKSFIDTDVDGNNAYAYYLEPYKTVSGTDYTAFTSGYGPITYLDPVSKLTGSMTPDDADDYGRVYVSLSWDPVEGADGYNIRLKTSDDSSFYLHDTIYGAEKTEWAGYLYEGFGKYQFAVVPIKNVNSMTAEGGQSNVLTFFNLRAPELYLPYNVSAIAIEYNTEDYETTQGIQIYRSINDGDFKPHKTFTLKAGQSYGEFTDTSARKSGYTYSYQARVFVKSGRETLYGPFCEPVSKMYLSAPALKSVKQNAVGSLDLTFTAVNGATAYEIGRSYSDYPESDGNMVPLTTVMASDPKAKTITFRDDTVQNPGYYRYVVRAVSAGNNLYGETYHSAFSKSLSGMTTSAPELIGIQNLVKGIEIFWSPGSVGDKIEIWRSIDGGAYRKLKALNAYGDGRYADTSATKSGSTYSYQIRSLSKKGSNSFYSAFSQECSLVKLNSPKITSVKNLAGGGFTFTFARVPEADYYTINTFCDNVFVHSTRIPEFTDKTYTFESPDATQTDILYTYYVTAHRNDKSNATSVVNAYHFGSMIVNAENTTSGIRVTGAHAHADHFTIYRSVDGGKWTKMKKVAASYMGELDWTDTRVSAGKTYQYRVLPGSRYNAETAEYSHAAGCLRIVSPKITELANRKDGISLNWKTNPALSVSSYEIWRGTAMYYSPDASFVLDKIGEVTAEHATYLDAEIGDEPVSVVYVVKAILDDGTVLSSDRTFIFRMPSPTNLYVYPIDMKSAEISWRYSGYCTGSQIRYTANGKTKTVTSNNAMPFYLLKGLSSGKVYSVTVRLMLRIDGKTYYSDWCTPIVFAP